VSIRTLPTFWTGRTRTSPRLSYSFPSFPFISQVAQMQSLETTTATLRTQNSQLKRQLAEASKELDRISAERAEAEKLADSARRRMGGVDPRVEGLWGW